MSEDKRDAFGRIQEEPTVIVGGFNNEPGLTPPADDVREALADLIEKAREDWSRLANNPEYGADAPTAIADAIFATYEVRPRGTVTDTDDVREALAKALFYEDNGKTVFRYSDPRVTTDDDAFIAGLIPAVLAAVRGTVTDATGVRAIRECTLCGEKATLSNATDEWEQRHSHGMA